MPRLDSIGGIPNNCVMNSIQHATGLPEEEVLKAYVHQAKHPKGEHRWVPGQPPKGNEGREALEHLGWNQKMVPVRAHGNVATDKETGDRYLEPASAREVAKRHPGGNFLAGTYIVDDYGNRIQHTFNIKYGKIHDRDKVADGNTPVLSLHHLTRKSRFARESLEYLRYLIENRYISNYEFNCALNAVKHVTDADDEDVLRAFEKSPNYSPGHRHHPLVVKDAIHHLGWRGKKVPDDQYYTPIPNSTIAKRSHSVTEIAKKFHRGRFLGFSGGADMVFGIKHGRSNLYNPDLFHVTHLFRIRRR